MSRHINSWNDLQQYGINPLTGEACAYSIRLLCDLNEDGVDLVRDFFGMQIVLNPAVQFAANWNSSVEGKQAIASIMLPRSIFPDLVRFLLFNLHKCDYVVEKIGGNGYAGYTDADLAAIERTPEQVGKIYQGEMWRNPKNPSASRGSRNVHQMTGRTT